MVPPTAVPALTSETGLPVYRLLVPLGSSVTEEAALLMVSVSFTGASAG